jgi:hypothetical protein
MSQGRRALYATVAVLALTTTVWAGSAYWNVASLAAVAQPVEQSEAEAKAVSLAAPLPPPTAVFLEKTEKFLELGNALVLVELSAEDLAAKEADGTRDFVTIGSPDATVLLRDDGQGADEKAGDGLFTGVAMVDDSELEARGEADATQLAASQEKLVPRFVGRTAQGVEKPEPFDASGFAAGRRVRLNPAVVFLQPETAPAQSETPITGKRAFGAKISSLLPVVLGTNQFQERVLIIRDLGVVTDPARTFDPCTGGGNPAGVWTFNHLITQMANQTASGIPPAQFAESWLLNWPAAKNINGDVVIGRPKMNTLISLWKAGGTSLPLNAAPLRLLAILPRLDLRRTTGGGGAYSINTSGNFLDAGEARFVFGFVLKPGWSGAGFTSAVQIPGAPAGCRALPFTVILEYRIAKCDCEEVRSWAKQWVALKDFVPGTAAYNTRLQVLTEQFVRANANPRNPNGSSLGQLRTNEIALTQAPPFDWELREFQLTQFPFTFLQETTVEDTIQDIFNNSNNPASPLAQWIVNQVKPNLVGPTFEQPIPPVPLLFSGGGFLAGNSIVPTPPGASHFWNEGSLNVAGDLQENWARHRVSRAACNGCHAGETGTDFVHVDPDDSIPGTTAALPAAISVFLSGINNLPDPANGTPTRNFDDLARRELDIQKVAAMTCSKFTPIKIDLVQASLLQFGKLPVELVGPEPEHKHLSVSIDDMSRNLITDVH